MFIEMALAHSVFLERLGQFFTCSSTVWIMAISTLSIMCAFYLTKKEHIPEKRIPGPNVNRVIFTLLPIINMFRNKRASIRVLLFQSINGYAHVFQKEGMLLFWIGMKSIIMLYKPETVEPVLNSTEILDKGFEYDFISGWLKEGLLTSKSNKWRYRRKLITPAFHFRILDEFIPVFNEQSKVLAKKIASVMKTQPWVDIAPLMSLCTLDIICETAMGKEINAQENSTSPYVQAMHKVCKLVPERIIQPWLWPDFIYNMTSKGKAYNKCLNVMEKFTKQVVLEKKSEKLKLLNSTNQEDENELKSSDQDIGCKTKRKLALLDLLLDLHLKNDSFTLDDIAEEVDNFMFAGHDTTSSGLSSALYMLGLYPEIQKKVQEELDRVLGEDVDEQITMDHIKKLKYMDCVLKETRRLLPPTPFIAREITKDTIINGYKIPKGTSCGILIYMLHRDPEVFPNPEIFDPERFSLANSAGRHPFAYVPFSAGPRNCIGQRFATFESITVMATILRQFNIKAVDPMDKLLIVDELVLHCENGLRLIFTARPHLKKTIVSPTIHLNGTVIPSN